MSNLSVSEVARRLGTRPRNISDLFYARKLSDTRCPVVGGRRLIPADYIPTIAKVLAAEDASATKPAHPSNRQGTKPGSPQEKKTRSTP